ncbi:MAG: TonB family protein [Prevotellaceae bacterium]|jgi:protein TonB|nr:TonB family protein [Prevotellaceae bacterium]
MEIKKSPKANLERKKILFTEIGVVIALLLLLIAFEWKTYHKTVSLITFGNQVATEEEMVPITQPDLPPPPEKPVVKPVVVSNVIQVVNDNVKIDNPIIVASGEDTQVQIMEYTAPEEEEEEVVEDIPFAIVEEKPKFMGGDENDFTRWVFQNLSYPDEAKEHRIQGRVMVSFRVTAEGKVTDVKILRGVDPSLDKEAIRVISMSPRWTPGKQRNKAVPVRYQFPVTFKL